MRGILPVLALAAVGCAPLLRGPDTCAEIHFDATYVLARWAGWPPDEALAIAAADFWTDQHGATSSVATERRIVAGLVNPAAIPGILCSGLGDIVVGGESPRRAFGRRAAEATAWAVPELGHRLHFPASDLRERVSPAFTVDPESGEIEYGSGESRRVLERAFAAFQTHEEDAPAALALLGIGLHTLQDSFKHCGFNAAHGHVGCDPDPDHACGDLDRSVLIAELTLNCLRYARRLSAGASTPPPAGWKDKLRVAFAEGSGLVAEGREELLGRWRLARGEEAFERALEPVRDAMRPSRVLLTRAGGTSASLR
jgi:hypothetical protein